MRVWISTGTHGASAWEVLSLVTVVVRLVDGADDAPVRALGTVLWSSALLPLLHLALDPADVPRLQALPVVATVEWPRTGSTQGIA